MKTIAVLTVGAWLVAAGVAAGQPVESASGRLRLTPAPDGAVSVASVDGESRLATPPGFRPYGLSELAGGWLLAGDAEDGAGRGLHLVRHDGSAATELPEPPGRVGLYRIQPVPLVAAGELRGLAWLEGDGPRSLAVRAATWTGGGWLPGPWVSTPGPGSQLALSATVLDDGSWLILWSAFDGEDDEIHWSRGDGQTFEPPRRLLDDNRVPDILPGVVAVPGGALAAWSRFDGRDYRLQLARLAGDRWLPLDWQGGRGSFAAGFLARAGRTYLLFHTVAGDSWQLLELSRSGRQVRRRAVAPDSPRPRPEVEIGRRGPLLTWRAGGAELTVELEWEQP